MVRVPRLELGAFRLGGGCSIHLSYTRADWGAKPVTVYDQNLPRASWENPARQVWLSCTE
jgi:hypothetical protein